jgi:hypothetical protein
MIFLPRTVQNGLVHRTGWVRLITRIRPPLSIVDYRFVFLKLVLLITRRSTGSDLFFSKFPRILVLEYFHYYVKTSAHDRPASYVPYAHLPGAARPPRKKTKNQQNRQFTGRLPRSLLSYLGVVAEISPALLRAGLPACGG